MDPFHRRLTRTACELHLQHFFIKFHSFPYIFTKFPYISMQILPACKRKAMKSINCNDTCLNYTESIKHKPHIRHDIFFLRLDKCNMAIWGKIGNVKMLKSSPIWIWWAASHVSQTWMMYFAFFMEILIQFMQYFFFATTEVQARDWK